MRIPVLVRTWTHDFGTMEKLLDTGAEIVSHCYYPPVGIRSRGSIRVECVEIDSNEWNKRMVTIMMIETPEAIKNAEAIAKVEHDVKSLTEVCRKAGKAAGVIVLNTDDLVERLKEGYQLICADFDVDHARNQFRLTRDVFNETLDNSGA